MKGDSTSSSGSSIYSGKAESIRSFDGSETKSSSRKDRESKREPSRDSRDGGKESSRRDRASEQAAYLRDEGRPESIAESRYENWEDSRADAREQLRKKKTGRRE